MENFEQQVRLDAVRAAVKVASPHYDAANLLVHAKWFAQFILNGDDPVIAAVDPQSCKATDTHPVGLAP